MTVFERDEAGGGLVRFGVPDFKIEKRIVERRVEQLAAEGVVFRFGADVGGNVPVDELRAVRRGRDRDRRARSRATCRCPGRELGGVHFAMDYLYQRNRFVAREEGPTVAGAPEPPSSDEVITAAGKHVIVIGGGDTGADCVANAHREGRGVGDPDRADRRAAAPRAPTR